MILKALADYYQRLLDDPSMDIAPYGFEKKIIDFIIVINESGQFIDLVDTREGTGRKTKGRKFLVPKTVKRTAGIAANLLWDTPPYVLGWVEGNEKRRNERAKDQNKAFLERIKKIFISCDDLGVLAVEHFLGKSDFSPIFNHPIWNEIKENGGNLSFMLEGDIRLVCQRPAVINAFLESQKTSGRRMQVCAISGEKDEPAELHAVIKGVWGARPSGANIVSFNLDAFRSFGKKQGYNAPVGKRIEFAYTTALNYLLASERQRVQVGDASTVFWAKEPCNFENDFYALIGQPKKGEENVSYQKIRGLLAAVKSGIPPEEEKLPFYVLGLAPNASRVAIRFWYEGSVGEIKKRLAEHFQDIEIIHSPHDPPYLSLFRLLLSVAAEYKADNIPPNLGGEVMRSVLTGLPYPRTLFANAIRRCKAEQKIDFARAAVIKGFLERNARISTTNRKEVSMALDKEYEVLR